MKGLATQPQAVQAAARGLLDEIRIARGVARSSRQFEALRSRKGLKLHLGCGAELKPGWVNVDLNLHGNVPRVTPGMAEGTVFINYDLREGVLPLDDGSCDLIYSSHFFEHLECRQGARLMQDCHRALGPGGVFRVALPTFRNLFRAYVEGDRSYFDLVDIHEALPDLLPGTESLVDHVNYGVYQGGEHKCLYDEEKVCLLLRRAGFSEAAPAPYREGLDPADELRRRYSFYVEAVK